MWTDIFFGYVCPSLGCVLSAAMYGAPIDDLRSALSEGKLGSLNPVPWAVMTGNCVGWCAYAYYAKDPFILASNIPGLVLSIWLNMGAAKLQYNQRRLEETTTTVQPADTYSNIVSSSNRREILVFSPQESLLLRIVMVWIFILVIVGWLGLFDGYEQITIGLLVNINLVFFYGAPLQTMSTIIAEKCSNSIHVPTMVMNWFNTSFWVLYGLAKADPIIYVPNLIGLSLGVTQAILCLFYPRRRAPDIDMQPLLNDEQDNDEDNLEAQEPEATRTDDGSQLV